MNFDERHAFIGRFLREVVMPRYKRPDHFDDATARREMADLVTDLNSEWPVIPPEQMAEFAERFFANLRKTYSGRTWPPIAAMVKAIRFRDERTIAAMTKPEKIDYEAIRQKQVRTWLDGKGPVVPGFVTPERLRAMGVPAAIAARAMAFVADPENHSIPERQE